MTDAGARRLEHVVLPRRRPGLALLERYYPSPADNVLDAELAAFTSPGDTVLDPWAGTGWTARRAALHGLLAVAADPSPFAQLAARALLQAPEPATLDAAFAQLAGSRLVDVPLRRHVEELYATRCAACRRPVVGDQFIWPRDGDAPGRKLYHCSGCDAAVGGPPERVAPVDADDLVRLGALRDGRYAGEPPDPSLDDPAGPLGLTAFADDRGSQGPPPPEPRGQPTAIGFDPPSGRAAAFGRRPAAVSPAQVRETRAGLWQSGTGVELRRRFPVLDGRSELVDELLALFTPRNLHALDAIADKIDAEFGAAAAGDVLRLALAACLLPSSRLNGYPGRVASLRIANGHVREPSSRHQREVNVWRLFEQAFRDVQAAIAALGDERPHVRFAADLAELGGMRAANVLWLRARAGLVGQHLPPASVDFVLGCPSRGGGLDELSFEYLATSWLLGREAAETLRLEPLFGPSSGRTEVGEAPALRHAISAAEAALKPGGWCSLLLEGDDLERMVATAVAAAGVGLELIEAIPRESRRTGNGTVLHFRKFSAEDRLREAVGQQPLRLGAEAGHLTYPELADAVEAGVVALLRDRGEPAAIGRITAAVLLEVQRRGLLRRLAHARSGADEAGADGGLDHGGPALLAALLREELQRDDHPSLVRVDESGATRWWLRHPEVTDSPLADRVEWSAFSVLSTAGPLEEGAFLDRIYRLFPGVASPDEELVRAAIGAYAIVDERGWLHPRDDLSERLADHTRILGLLADFGHRLGCRVWISRREQPQPFAGATLGDLLHDDERRVYLPLIVRGRGKALGLMDALWYVRGRFAFVIEVEWTAILGELILHRGRQIEPGDEQARLFVFPAERSDLVRLKLERSPWIRAEMERQNWHLLKWQHLETLASKDGTPTLEWLQPVLGLDPLIERSGEQLTMFGE